MPCRWTHLRKVDRNRESAVSAHCPMSLFRAGVCAAEETIRGSPFASAWLQLFQEHLSESAPEMQRWRGSLGTSAEMRRAYSGLCGRYFACALLAGELGITGFISLETNCMRIGGGVVTVRRIRRSGIPDWTAWNPWGRHHVLGEVEGRLSGSLREYPTGTRSCVNAGKKQFLRVAVPDSRNRRISTRDLVAVNHWSTDEHGGQAVSLLWDPPGDGEPLMPEEARHPAQSMRRHGMETIAMRLGHPEFTMRIGIETSDSVMPSI